MGPCVRRALSFRIATCSTHRLSLIKLIVRGIPHFPRCCARCATMPALRRCCFLPRRDEPGRHVLQSPIHPSRCQRPDFALVSKMRTICRSTHHRTHSTSKVSDEVSQEVTIRGPSRNHDTIYRKLLELFRVRHCLLRELCYDAFSMVRVSKALPPPLRVQGIS